MTPPKYPPPPPPRPYRDMTDSEIDHAIYAKERARDQWRRRTMPFRESAHDGVDASVRGALKAWQDGMADLVGDFARPAHLPVVPGLAAAYLMAFDPAWAAAAHAAIDAAPAETYDSRTRDAYRDGLDALDAEIAALTFEQRARDIEARRAKLDAAERALVAQ